MVNVTDGTDDNTIFHTTDTKIQCRCIIKDLKQTSSLAAFLVSQTFPGMPAIAANIWTLVMLLIIHNDDSYGKNPQSSI